MRFHLPALPGRSVSRTNSACAYSQKVRKFARMMGDRGHECFIYEHGGEPPEFIPEQWAEANADQAARINDRREEGDILGLIAGECQRGIADAVPLTAVEYGIGYGGTFAPFRVFESYAWMHVVLGADHGAHTADGRFYDAVIPNYFEVEDFPFQAQPGDYLLYVGRLTGRKGIQVAEEAAERAGLPLILAGEGDYTPNYGEAVGHVGPEQRGKLMSEARALLAPTLYLEPFGGVVAEAALCGTPAITTDWGAFTETVHQGVTGYRCHLLREFVQAIELAPKLDRRHVRDFAVARFSLEAVGPQYENYFGRLLTLAGDGWYADETRQLA